MNKEIHNCLYNLYLDPGVSKVIRTRVPKVSNTLTKPLALTEKWLFQVYNGTFINEKFHSEWLGYHGIMTNMLDSVKGNMTLVCDLFEKTVKDCVKVSTDYDSFDTFLYNSNTFRSGFLRHATKIISIYNKDSLNSVLSKQTMDSLNLLQSKSIQPIWSMVQQFIDWHKDNYDSLITANFACTLHHNSLTCSRLMHKYSHWLNEKLEIASPGVLKVGNKWWWEFVSDVKKGNGVLLSPTASDIAAGLLIKRSNLGYRKMSNVKPKEYITWDFARKVEWDKNNG